ncbi:MAG: hypothetical protein HPY73_06045 [Methanomassiliicoccales archaeon]|nr:MAG: hypothetical protein HPY73_06045 [Methanomassiliicoccales archaeon]
MCLVSGKGGRRPKRVMQDNEGSSQFQFAWNSTPKYPKHLDNGRDDEGYYAPIKKLHTMKNYEETSKGRKKK